MTLFVDGSGRVLMRSGSAIDSGILNNPVGINFAAGGTAALNGMGFPIFQDIVRESSIGQATAPGTLTLNTFPTFDANGWPTSDFGLLCKNINTTQSWTSGTYKCGFTGAGTEVVTAWGSSASVSNIVRVGGVVTFDMVVTGPQFGFTCTSVSTSVTNLFGYLPAYASQAAGGYSAASLFTTDAVAHYKNFGWIRWMWMQNAWYCTDTVTSASRNTAANTHFRGNWGIVNNAKTTHDGYPVEWLVDFCVACNIGGYFHVPIRADSTWISWFGNYLKSNMPAGKPIWIEIGNEIWTGISPINAAFNADATAAGLTNLQYLGKVIHDVAVILQPIFGADWGNRVKLIHAWQQSQTSQFNTTLAYINTTYAVSPGTYAAAISMAPYINRNNTSLPGDGVNHTNVEESIAVIQSEWDTNAKYRPLVVDKAEEMCAIGRRYGINTAICYEGYFDNSSDTTATQTGLAEMDSGTTAVGVDWCSKMLDIGFNALTIFESGISTSTDVRSPFFTLSNSYSSLTSTGSPKYNALTGFFSAAYTRQRNVVVSGQLIDGRNCIGSDPSVNASYPTFTVGTFSFPAYSAGDQGRIGYQVYDPNGGIYALALNITSTSTRTTNVELNGTTVISGVSLPTGLTTTDVALGSVTLVKGFNVLIFGNGSNQSGVSVIGVRFT